MKLVWTFPARADRKSIREFIAIDNPSSLSDFGRPARKVRQAASAALDLDELLSERAARLLDHPGLGRPGRLKGTRELVAHRNYILIYDVVGELVRALRVLHTARQWPPARH